MGEQCEKRKLLNTYPPNIGPGLVFWLLTQQLIPRPGMCSGNESISHKLLYHLCPRPCFLTHTPSMSPGSLW